MVSRVWYRGLLSALPALACVFALGCGGVKTYRVSGKVKYKGNPVPAGKIYFIPDSSKGNSGPTGYADIKDGEYDTSSSGGRDAPAGPVIIAVEGLDPSAAPDKADTAEKGNKSEEASVKLLFARYELAHEVPTSSSTKDIEVPAEASKGPTQKKDPNIVIP
jgi:hypothetical protein